MTCVITFETAALLGLLDAAVDFTQRKTVQKDLHPLAMILSADLGDE